ncbi:MAG: dihydrodipicolinate reductase C-terminal domain-containing protein [Acidobacteriota bacterium]
MKIALIGYGAMGKLIERLANGKGHESAVVVVDADAGISASALAEKISGVDVAIDFTVAEAVRRNVEACLAANVPLVEGTTGWNDERAAIERLVREGVGAMVFGANFSVGVNLFYRVTEFAAELFSQFPDYEAFIEEQHHSRKKDSPSGTALTLKDIVATHTKTEFSVAATRAGNIPGTHRVGFDGPSDQILLEHTARSRDGFADGAILAAEWIVGKSGFYEFSEVMDELVG